MEFDLKLMKRHFWSIFSENNLFGPCFIQNMNFLAIFETICDFWPFCRWIIEFSPKITSLTIFAENRTFFQLLRVAQLNNNHSFVLSRHRDTLNIYVYRILFLLFSLFLFVACILYISSRIDHLLSPLSHTMRLPKVYFCIFKMK